MRTGIALILALFFVTVAFAADPSSAQKGKPAWKTDRTKVGSPVEKKYDTNGDGWIDPAEAKVILKNKQAEVKTQGQAKVETAVEKGYDTNKNGVISREEADAMEDDLLE